MAKTVQRSFTAGEVSSSLRARVDLAKYLQALARCENFVVLGEGGLSRRPGTELVDETKLSQAAVFIPFVFSEDQSYVLVLGPAYIRVYAGGGAVLDGDAIVEIPSPYAPEDLRQIRYAQSADVLFLVHGLYEIDELHRRSDTEWELVSWSVERGIPAPAAPVVTGYNSSAGSFPKDWTWVVTAVHVNGNESLPSDPTTASVTLDATPNPSTNNGPATVAWSAVLDDDGQPADYYRVFRGRNGVYGWVGDCRGATTFNDDNVAPVYTVTPPFGRNPFSALGQYPRTVTFYKQRLVLGGTMNAPDTLFLSQPGNFRNFDVAVPPKDDDALELTLASTQLDEIRGLVAVRSLLVLTAGAEWSMAPSENLGPGSYDINPQGSRGSAWVAPLVVGSSVLFVQRDGRVVRDLAFSYQIDGYDTNELSILAKHLFQGRRVVSWTYQQSPDSIVWVVMDDGALLALTFIREHEVWAWSQHATDGAVEDVCSVPEGGADRVYLIVRREINGETKRYIERMALREVDDPVTSCRVDCSRAYDGTTVVAGREVAVFPAPGGPGTYDADDPLDVQVTGAALFAAGDVGDAVVVYDGDTPVRLRILDVQSGNLVSAVSEAEVPEAYRSTFNGNWAFGRRSFHNLAHLEGKSVAILADGHVHPPRTVVNGGISIDIAAVKVRVGLPYTSALETLPLNAEGDIRTRRKRVVAAVVDASGYSSFSAGPVGGRMDPARTRLPLVSGAPAPIVDEPIRVATSSSWRRNGAVRVEASDPLPLDILAIEPEFEVGGG